MLVLLYKTHHRTQLFTLRPIVAALFLILFVLCLVGFYVLSESFVRSVSLGYKKVARRLRPSIEVYALYPLL